MQPDQMQGQMPPQDPNQGGSDLPPMMLVQIIKAIQPFIQQIVAQEVAKAIGGEQQQEVPLQPEQTGGYVGQ